MLVFRRYPEAWNRFDTVSCCLEVPRGLCSLPEAGCLPVEKSCID